MGILTNLNTLVQQSVDSSYADAQVKTKYENNANTNAFTDAEKVKVGNVSVTQPVDLDSIEAHTVSTTNPHSVTKAQVGLGSVDDVSAINLRDRTTHTGSQLASTISDFTAATKLAETTTSLALVANTLTYTDEDGVATNLDLSLYLDDTNLSRLTSATLDGGTGIATFTRDDASTFTLDLSNLLDNQVASEVPVTAVGNLVSTNVQSALQELQSDIDTINNIVEVV